MKIIYMGTPDFAVGPLEALLAGGHEIVCVLTQADKPKGRGHQLQAPPVKEAALKAGIPVLQPQKMKDPELWETLRGYGADLFVVAAYGKILPPEILSIPPRGCVNIHASLLPLYRGAAPIQQSVLDGCTVTGVTAQCMDIGIDTGDILMKSETEIGENETADELHDRLSEMGAELIVKVVHAAAEGTLVREKQDDSKASHVGKLTKEMSVIDFTKSAKHIHDQVRGLNSWPSACASLNGKRIKIHRTLIAQGKGEPGQVLSLSPLTVACGEGALEITELQPEGKKKMDARSFVNGLHIKNASELKFS